MPERDDSLFYDIERYLKTVHKEDRLMETVRLYFSYGLTVDQLGELLASGLIDSAIGELRYQADFPWYQRFIDIDSYENLQEASRPFIWALDTLNAEFPDFLSHFSVKARIDVCKAERNEGGFYDLAITEEHGFISVGDIMFSRTLQPIFFERQISEPIVVLMPFMAQQTFLDTIPYVNSVSGGCEFEGICEAKPLNPRFADLIGLTGAATVMLYRGFKKDGETIALEQRIGLDPDMYLDFKYQNEPIFILSEADKKD